jgi:hypothetical protein
VIKSFNIFTKILIIALLIWLCVELEITIKQSQNSNWCSPEIDSLKEMVGDLWYLNGLDNVTLDKSQ